MKNQMNSNVPMIPCAYNHFLAKASTLTLKSMELYEGMEKEGAADDVLEAITQAFKAVKAAETTIKFAKALREQQMEDERTAKRSAREAEAAVKKLQAAAKKASKDSTVEVPSSVTQEDGPEGPSVTAS